MPKETEAMDQETILERLTRSMTPEEAAAFVPITGEEIDEALRLGAEYYDSTQYRVITRPSGW